MPQLVTIAQVRSETEAQFALLRLTDAGIVARLANRNIHAVRDMAGYAAYIWVQVAEPDAERARAVLAEPLPELSVGDEIAMTLEAEALARCPECGKEDVEYSHDGVRTVARCSACRATWRL
jgi:hypothetical protein